MCRCDAEGHGFMVVLAVLGWWLDLMISKILSNLNDSVIL